MPTPAHKGIIAKGKATIGPPSAARMVIPAITNATMDAILGSFSDVGMIGPLYESRVNGTAREFVDAAGATHRNPRSGRPNPCSICISRLSPDKMPRKVWHNVLMGQ